MKYIAFGTKGGYSPPWSSSIEGIMVGV